MIGERRLPSITTYPAHRQRVAHLNEQSGVWLGLGREALGVASSFADLPILLCIASRTLARPFDSILCLSAAMMLMTSFGPLPSVPTSI